MSNPNNAIAMLRGVSSGDVGLVVSNDNVAVAPVLTPLCQIPLNSDAQEEATKLVTIADKKEVVDIVHTIDQ